MNKTVSVSYVVHRDISQIFRQISWRLAAVSSASGCWIVWLITFFNCSSSRGNGGCYRRTIGRCDCDKLDIIVPCVENVIRIHLPICLLKCHLRSAQFACIVMKLCSLPCLCSAVVVGRPVYQVEKKEEVEIIEECENAEDDFSITVCFFVLSLRLCLKT